MTLGFKLNTLYACDLLYDRDFEEPASVGF